MLNGKPLVNGQPAPLAAGDLLVVAGVLTLQVDLEGQGRGKTVAGEVAVPNTAVGTQVMLEASLGDMMTLE